MSKPSRDAFRDGLPLIPGYEMLGLIRRCPRGVIYRARHQHLNRFVSIKVPLVGEPYVSPEPLAAFRREAETIARLAHPNIIEIRDFVGNFVGESDGFPYIAMEPMEGQFLGDRLREGPLPVSQAADISEALAGAVHHMHQRGVVHHNLNPEDILLLADGTPKIADFEQAVPVGEEPPALFPHGSMPVLSSHAYLAPEQLKGETRQAGTATDVWHLGVVLYELLTGRTPHRGESYIDTVMQIMKQEPEPPSRHRREVPPDLDAICLRCLEKEPAQRYPSALALADDLQRFLKGQAPLAPKPTALKRFLRWFRRRGSEG
jgi:serine/threonine protein kinase